MIFDGNPPSTVGLDGTDPAGWRTWSSVRGFRDRDITESSRLDADAIPKNRNRQILFFQAVIPCSHPLQVKYSRPISTGGVWRGSETQVTTQRESEFGWGKEREINWKFSHTCTYVYIPCRQPSDVIFPRESLVRTWQPCCKCWASLGITLCEQPSNGHHRRSAG